MLDVQLIFILCANTILKQCFIMIHERVSGILAIILIINNIILVHDVL